MEVLILLIILLPITIFYLTRKKHEKNDNLVFRIGGVGIKNIDYKKAYEANKEILLKMAKKNEN